MIKKLRFNDGKNQETDQSTEEVLTGTSTKWTNSLSTTRLLTFFISTKLFCKLHQYLTYFLWVTRCANVIFWTLNESIATSRYSYWWFCKGSGMGTNKLTHANLVVFWQSIHWAIADPFDWQIRKEVKIHQCNVDTFTWHILHFCCSVFKLHQWSKYFLRVTLSANNFLRHKATKLLWVGNDY